MTTPPLIQSIALLAFALGALGGCNSNSNDSGATPTAAATLSATPSKSLDEIGTPIARFDPCGLLAIKDVEAALGAPLAVPPYRTSDAQAGRSGAPDADGHSCYYVTADFHNIHVGTVERGGAQALALIRKFSGVVKKASGKVVVISKGSTIDGAWDDVELIGCCDLFAVLGEHAVDVNVAGSKATIAEAAALVEAALKRFDKPLPIDGSSAAAAAQALLATRPRTGAACTLVSRAEAEAIVGPLGAEPIPRNNGNGCEVHAAKGTFLWKIEDASGGYAAMRGMTTSLSKDAGDVTRQAQAEGMNAQSMKVIGNLASGLALTPVDNPAWEQGVVSMRGLYVVRKDVRVACATTNSPEQIDICTKLAATVTARL